MIDAESLIRSLLIRDTDATVYAEQDTSDTDPLTLPAVVWDLTVDGQTGNGDGLWSGMLGLRVIAVPDEAFSTASDLYDAVHGWPADSTVDGAWVTYVRDVQTVNRPQSTNTVGKGVSLYQMSFTIIIRN